MAKILVVDDDPMNLKLALTVLARPTMRCSPRRAAKRASRRRWRTRPIKEFLASVARLIGEKRRDG